MTHRTTASTQRGQSHPRELPPARASIALRPRRRRRSRRGATPSEMSCPCSRRRTASASGPHLPGFTTTRSEEEREATLGMYHPEAGTAEIIWHAVVQNGRGPLTGACCWNTRLSTITGSSHGDDQAFAFSRRTQSPEVLHTHQLVDRGVDAGEEHASAIAGGAQAEANSAKVVRDGYR